MIPTIVAKTVLASDRLVQLCAPFFHRKTIEGLAAQKIPGRPRIINNFQRNITISAKLNILRPEFHGSNELCFDIVRRIIEIRRGKSVPQNMLFLMCAIYQQPVELFGELSSRWILSILDTIVDHGASLHALSASSVTAFILGNRLGFTVAKLTSKEIFRLKPDEREAPNSLDEKVRISTIISRREIWDNVIYFNFVGGDTYQKYMERTHDLIQRRKPIFVAWQFLISRMNESEKYDGVLTYDRASKDALRRYTDRSTSD